MTLLNVSDLSHHYAHGGFSGKPAKPSPCWDAAAAEKAPSRGCW